MNSINAHTHATTTTTSIAALRHAGRPIRFAQLRFFTLPSPRPTSASFTFHSFSLLASTRIDGTA